MTQYSVKWEVDAEAAVEAWESMRATLGLLEGGIS